MFNCLPERKHRVAQSSPQGCFSQLEWTTQVIPGSFSNCALGQGGLSWLASDPYNQESLFIYLRHFQASQDQSHMYIYDWQLPILQSTVPYSPRASFRHSLCHQHLLTCQLPCLLFSGTSGYRELSSVLQPHHELLCFYAFVHEVPITGKAFPLFLDNWCLSFKIELKHHCRQEALLISPSWARALHPP